MKKLTCIVIFILFSTTPIFAASQNPTSGLPPGTPGGAHAAGLPDYVSRSNVPLSDKELKALQLSNQWSKNNIPPVLSGGGKIVYVHGAVLPSIIASPMQVCDVELQPGEQVNEIIVGDSARWIIEIGSSGTGPKAITHLFIKPVDAGLESTAIITTDRRVYHLRLISRREGHTPYIGFTYADDLRLQAESKKQQEDKAAKWRAANTAEGTTVDLASLNFGYSIKGDRVNWKPERIYDDGRQMFIQLPASSKTGEMPVLLVRKGNQDILVNYRIKDSTMVVDGLFDRIVLIIGVGSSQEKVEIRKDV